MYLDDGMQFRTIVANKIINRQVLKSLPPTLQNYKAHCRSVGLEDRIEILVANRNECFQTSKWPIFRRRFWRR